MIANCFLLVGHIPIPTTPRLSTLWQLRSPPFADPCIAAAPCCETVELFTGNSAESILKALHLQSLEGTQKKQLDLGSLRAGGATWLLQASEDSELCKGGAVVKPSHHGDIHPRSGCAPLLHKLPPRAKFKVFSLLPSFHDIIQKAEEYAAALIPFLVWYTLFTVG